MRLLWLSILLLSPVIRAAVLAIDYGAEFTKLSLVKPGVPFDVILDRDSKRKIQSVVGWKREDRVFGAEGKVSVSPYLVGTGRCAKRIGYQVPGYALPLCQAITWCSFASERLCSAISQYSNNNELRQWHDILCSSFFA
jgi:hypothetical protein